MRWAAVIVAAGRGTRFGRPKQLVELGGIPLLAHSVDTFAAMPEVAQIVVVTEPEFVELVETLVLPRAGATPGTVVVGGADRQASGYNGVLRCAPECGGIFIHDGARPLVRADDVRAGMAVVRAGVGALLAAQVVDTIKQVDANRMVLRTLDRTTLWSAQTPQLATAGDMRRAHSEALRLDWPRATDDAALLEMAGVKVVVVPSSPDNIKVTHPGDLVRAAALLRQLERR